MKDERTLADRLTDPDFRGPMQHLRDWSELDRLHDEAAQALRSQPSVEEVARVIDPEVWADSLPVPTRIDVIAFHFRRQDSVTRARQIKALYEEGKG